MARPKLDIDPKEVEKLAALQCTYEEMAAFFGCDRTTIHKRFSTEVAKGKERGKISLRRTQFRLAEKSPAMAIWLGKQYLGQTEKHEYVNQDVMGQHINILNINKPNGERKKFKRFYDSAQKL